MKLKGKFKFSEQEKEGRAYFEHVRDHSRPVGRRQFLGLGLTASTVSLIAPILPLQNLYAFSCEKSAGSASNNSVFSFINYDLAGGANLSGYIIDDLRLESSARTLEKLGYVNKQLLQDNLKPFGGHYLVQNTPFGDSIINTLGQDYDAINEKLTVVSFIANSNNDSNSNQANINACVNNLQTKLAASFLAPGFHTGGGGIRNENNSRFVSVGNTDLLPNRMDNNAGTAEILKLVEAGRVSEVLNPKQNPKQKIEEFFNLFANINASLHRRYQAASQLNAKLAEKNYCLYEKAKDNILNVNAEAIQAKYNNDPVMQQVFGNNLGGLNGMTARTATGVAALHHGDVGMFVVTSGGWDYHNNSPGPQINRQNEHGVQFAQALRYLHLQNNAAVFSTKTDGGASARAGNNQLSEVRLAASNEDANVGCISTTFLASGTNKLVSLQTTIGGYTDSGNINLSKQNKVTSSCLNAALCEFFHITLAAVQDHPKAIQMYKNICAQEGITNPFTDKELSPGGEYCAFTIG